MKLQTVKNAVTSKVARQVLKTQKHSPQLLFAGGVIGIAGTVVLACRATLKLEEVLIQAEKDHADVDQLTKNTRRETARDHAYINVRTALEISKLYAPAVTVGVASVAALTGSHVILTKRNVALTAAYKAIEEGFEKYRDRVREEFGEEKELEIRHGSEIVSNYQFNEKGEPISGKNMLAPLDKPSVYARFFDELNPNWQRHPEYNLIFLNNQQSWLNDKLHARGHVFLNEVYDALGMERSKAGAVVGWVVRKDGGDNYIDFGHFNSDNPRARDFVNGREPSILLDFNVDGVILDLI